MFGRASLPAEDAPGPGLVTGVSYTRNKTKDTGQAAAQHDLTSSVRLIRSEFESVGCFLSHSAFRFVCALALLFISIQRCSSHLTLTFNSLSTFASTGHLQPPKCPPSQAETTRRTASARSPSPTMT
jgi:hypothetical protein